MFKRIASLVNKYILEPIQAFLRLPGVATTCTIATASAVAVVIGDITPLTAIVTTSYAMIVTLTFMCFTSDSAVECCTIAAKSLAPFVVMVIAVTLSNYTTIAISAVIAIAAAAGIATAIVTDMFEFVVTQDIAETE